MSGGRENFMLNKLDELYENNEHDKIIVFVNSVDPEHRNEELTVRLARSVMDRSAENNSETIADIERILMRFVPRSSDPLLYYLLGKCCFYSDNSLESVKYLKRAKKLAEQDGCYSEISEEIREFYEVCKFSEQQENCRYGDDESENFKDIIRGIFGDIDVTTRSVNEYGLDFELLLIPANEKHDCDIYMTFGLGAYPINRDPAKDSAGAEYMVYFPHNWDEKRRREMQRYLISIAVLSVEKHINVTYGCGFSSDMPIMEGSQLNSTMLIKPMYIHSEEWQATLFTGRKIQFMQLMPIYKNELEYKLSYGNDALMKKLSAVSCAADPYRKSTCPKSDETLLGVEIDLAGEVGEKYCSVSRKITEEGERVGFMKRLFDSATEPQYKNESGWIIMAGTESGEFMLNPYNMTRSRLNTVCNIDPDIVPYIGEPANTVVFRTFDGSMRSERDIEEDDEFFGDENFYA